MAEGVGRKIEKSEEIVKAMEPRSPVKLGGLINGLGNMGVEDPRKYIHCLKVGLALSTVSVFYYTRPLNDALGGNAMWALMTVVVIFEYTVGATLCKSINRALGTIIAGLLGLGIHWIAVHCGKQYEPIITGISVFLVASLATFSRFIPSVKGRFDYGAVVFILTFTFISVSGYRVDELVALAEGRLSTVAVGASICILINMLVWPVWAGDQLRHQTISNLETLANALEGCISEYFGKSETAFTPEKDLAEKLQEYKCLLNSQAAEESMENFARWEPAHGHYHSADTWKQYLKICAAVRNCANCIDNLNSCLNSEMQVPEFLKVHIKEKCTRLSFCSSEVLKELAIMIKTRTRSTHVDVSITEMNMSAEELQNSLINLSLDSSNNDNSIEENFSKTPILNVLASGCIVTLMIESVARIEAIVVAAEKLATMAEFRIEEEMKSRVKETSECCEIDKCDQETIEVLEKV